MKTLFDQDLTFEEAEELIKNGADVNERNEYGDTPLHRIRNFEVAKLLIEHNVNINSSNIYGVTPIFNVRNLDIAQLFIKHGANLNAQSHDGLIVLFYISDIDLIDLYIRNGIDVNVIDSAGRIPLYYYSKLKNTSIVNLLVNAGANLNIKSDNGSVLSIVHQSSDLDKSFPKFFIDHGAVASEIEIYHVYRDLFSEEQQKAFDIFASITSDDNDFFQMCLAYQNDQKNNIKMDIAEMEIL